MHRATIPQAADALELKNIPTELILYAYKQWTYCGRYVTKGKGKNTNQFLQGVAAWLILKHETPSGKIQNYWSQLEYLAAKCKLSAGAMAKRIAWLRKEGLLQVVNRKHLVMSPYTLLKSKYNLNIREREETFYYDYSKKGDLASILITIAIGHAKKRRGNMYRKKLENNLLALAELRSLLVKFGADINRIDDPEYFREQHLRLLTRSYKNDIMDQSTYRFLHEVIDANPDLNAKEATYGREMGYSVLEKTNQYTGKDESESLGFGHLKRRLIEKGLIGITKEHINSEYRARKDEEKFHHRYDKDNTKTTVWFRPCQIWINYAAFYAA
jgi:hypothetical protein